MKKIIAAITPFVFLLACTTENTTPTCTTASGTEVCFKGKTYNFDNVFWEKVSDHIEIQLEPNVTGPGDYAGLYVFLYGTTIQSDTVPHVGSYTSIPFATSPTGAMDFSGYFSTISGSNMTSYEYVQDASNSLTIIAYSSLQVSGNGTFKVKNLTTNEVSSAVFSFENIPFQP